MKLETQIRVGHLDDLKLQVFELPYEGNRLSMIVFLPEENDGLKEVEKKLTADTLKRAMKSLLIHTVNLTFPKFKIEHTLPVKDLLIQLGMRDLFSQNADLSGMTEQRDIQVSDIFHKALVEINEEGTVAAASSGMVIVPLSLSYRYLKKKIVVRADHPFIFFIYDFKTSQVLFMGRIMDPRPESSRTKKEADDINNRQPFSSHVSSNPSTARIYTQWFRSPQHKWPYMYHRVPNHQLFRYRSPYMTETGYFFKPF
ncbi:unnamed protein product [Darwinula stevensoni]|uniref:Serpin domain-containing protein n=1 Tax=Darwinula stevensoni TaxID=69355 RepID=A0A7R8X7S1_9CRUS|nr:unnamed protein product [Darwinula stevensoni]CAG0889365.1 unnamed protein product [Darwinula stevensoni]